jgi:hypothetical protein
MLDRELRTLKEQRETEQHFGIHRFLNDPYLDQPRVGEIDAADNDPVMQALLRDPAKDDHDDADASSFSSSINATATATDAAPAAAASADDNKGVVVTAKKMSREEKRAATRREIASLPEAVVTARLPVRLRAHVDSLDQYLENLETEALHRGVDARELLVERRELIADGVEKAEDDLVHAMNRMQRLSMEPCGRESGWNEEVKRLETLYRQKHKRPMSEYARMQAKFMWMNQFDLQEKLHPPSTESFPPIVRLQYTHRPRESSLQSVSDAMRLVPPLAQTPAPTPALASTTVSSAKRTIPPVPVFEYSALTRPPMTTTTATTATTAGMGRTGGLPPPSARALQATKIDSAPPPPPPRLPHWKTRRSDDLSTAAVAATATPTAAATATPTAAAAVTPTAAAAVTPTAAAVATPTAAAVATPTAAAVATPTAAAVATPTAARYNDEPELQKRQTPDALLYATTPIPSTFDTSAAVRVRREADEVMQAKRALNTFSAGNLRRPYSLFGAPTPTIRPRSHPPTPSSSSTSTDLSTSSTAAIMTSKQGGALVDSNAPRSAADLARESAELKTKRENAARNERHRVGAFTNLLDAPLSHVPKKSNDNTVDELRLVMEKAARLARAAGISDLERLMSDAAARVGMQDDAYADDDPRAAGILAMVDPTFRKPNR